MDADPRTRVERPRRVAIVGTGWAGLAAAVELARAGVHCTLHEASRTLGGRARRVEWQVGGETLALDNGQHILIGAYRDTLALLHTIGVDTDDAFERKRLHWVATDGFELKATAHRAPWHLAFAILKARHASIDERWAMVRFVVEARRHAWTLDEDTSVVALLTAWHQPPSLIHRFWAPLCIAALNTHEEIASAQVFLNVLRDSLGAAAEDSDLLLPRVDLGSLLPDAAAAYLTDRVARPATIRLGQRVQNLSPDERGVVVTPGTPTVLGESERFDAVVVATPPQETARLFASLVPRDAGWQRLVRCCEAFRHQPIVTAYLLYRDAPKWSARMLALDVAPHVEHFGQWAFDRSESLSDGSQDGRRSPGAPRGLVAVVISADGAHRELEQDALVRALANQLAVQCGLPTQFVDARVIVEKRATFASVPGLARPTVETPVAQVVLCGDYVGDGDPLHAYPATIEAAVRSGRAAAARLLARFDIVATPG